MTNDEQRAAIHAYLGLGMTFDDIVKKAPDLQEMVLVVKADMRAQVAPKPAGTGSTKPPRAPARYAM